jgi:Glycosyl transferases group 1
VLINILIPTPGTPSGETWGETPFARSLARAFGEIGVTARILHLPRNRWLARFSLRRGTDLIIRGPYIFAPRIWPWTRTLIWLISFGDLRPAELRRCRHFFVASARFVTELQARGLPASEMQQCTDADLFSPDRARDDLATDVLFVGTWRKSFRRPIVHQAIATGHPPKIWGRRWKDHVDPDLLAGEFIPNDDLGAHYASAKVVLNDHMPEMSEPGFISNRVFDVLASGAELVSDRLPDLGVPMQGAAEAANAEAVGLAIEHALGSYDERKPARLALAEHVRTHHSFAARARQILAVIRKPRG